MRRNEEFWIPKNVDLTEEELNEWWDNRDE